MASTNGASTLYLYNALGQMIEKSGTLGTTILMQDEAGHLIGEYTSTGRLVEETVWLGNVPVATLQPNGSGGVNIFYVHSDHLNTPRKVSRPSDNQLEWRWDTDPFGTVAANQNPAGLGTFVYDLRFPGQTYQAETGINQNVNRDYDPAVGRYVESDPIGLAGGINTYVYVGDGPTQNWDSTGLAAYISLSFNLAYRFLALGSGYTEVTCKTDCGKVKRLRYVKVCVGTASSSGASLVAGGVSNMDGPKCDSNNYAGYFVELAGGIFGAAGGIDFGMSENRYHLPQRFTGVNEAGIGAGTPGMSALLCYYLPLQ
jgi:RHS repeat-associated protein